MGSYRALLIANSKYYEDTDLLELKAPIYDMARMQEALTHPVTGIFARERVELLPNAKCADVLLTMESFYQACQPDDTLLLYYSGHGKLDLYNNFFLCASDSRLDRLVSTAVRDDQVNAMMQSSPARTFVLVLDCCSSGAWKGTKELLPEPLKGSGRFLLTSSRAGQNSADAAIRTESSPFTRYLVEAISDADVDVDDDGYVDIDEIYRYVERSLKDAGPQEAQRDFNRSAGSVALARRPVSDKEMAEPPIEPEPTAPIGPLEPPSLNVTPERIEITGVRRGDLPVLERIYVFNRGGGSLEWEASSDEGWIGLDPLGDYVKVALAPPAEGTSRGTVYVRERGGAVERVPVAVQVEERGSLWPRLRKPALAAGALLAALVLVVASIALVRGGGPSPTPTPSPTPSPSVERIAGQYVLAWTAEPVDPLVGGGRVEAIGKADGEVIAAGTLDGRAAAWMPVAGRWEEIPYEADREGSILGLPPFDDAAVGVGVTGSPGDLDAAAWSISASAIDPLDAAVFEEAGDQIIHRASPAVDKSVLVAVGRDGDDAAVWRYDGGWERSPTEENGLGGAGRQVMLRVHRVTKADGAEILIAVGYEAIGNDEDGAVWIAGDDKGGSWSRVSGPGLPFVGDGRQSIIDVDTNGGLGLIAIGYAQSDTSDDLDAAAWLSPDGETWMRATPAVALGGSGDQVMTRIHASIENSGLPPIIAVGYDQLGENRNAAVWYSEDGRNWVKQRIGGTGLGGPGAQELRAFNVDRSEIVVVGYDNGSPAIWRGSCADHAMCT